MMQEISRELRDMYAYLCGSLLEPIRQHYSEPVVKLANKTFVELDVLIDLYLGKVSLEKLKELNFID